MQNPQVHATSPNVLCTKYHVHTPQHLSYAQAPTSLRPMLISEVMQLWISPLQSGYLKRTLTKQVTRRQKLDASLG